MQLMAEKFVPRAPRKYPLGDRIITQMELYDILLAPTVEKRDLASTVEPVILAIEEKSAPQCATLQCALWEQLNS